MKSIYHHHIDRTKAGLPFKREQRSLFQADEQDDVVLSLAGQKKWTVIGQDHKYHLEQIVLNVINEHQVGVFYMWGAEAPRWETMRCLARHFPRIVQLATDTQRPFIFKVPYQGQIRKVL